MFVLQCFLIIPRKKCIIRLLQTIELPNIINKGFEHAPVPRCTGLWINLCTKSRCQCHGLWDEDDPKEKKEPSRQSESEDEGKSKEESDRESAPASSVISETRGSTQTLRSINFGTSIDSAHVQVHYPQQQTYQRRKSSSGGSHISNRSLQSSARSKRGEDTLIFIQNF